MKKLLALLICLSLFICSVAFAAENELTKDVLEETTTVSLTIDPEENSFVVIIPSIVTIDAETQSGVFDIVLKSGWKLPSSNGLRLRIKDFANGPRSNVTASQSDDPAFAKMKNSEGAVANYKISVKSVSDSEYITLYDRYNPTTGLGMNNYWKIKNIINVLRTDSNATDQTASLKLEVPKLPTASGEYTDTITFEITLY